MYIRKGVVSIQRRIDCTLHQQGYVDAVITDKNLLPRSFGIAVREDIVDFFSREWHIIIWATFTIACHLRRFKCFVTCVYFKTVLKNFFSWRYSIGFRLGPGNSVSESATFVISLVWIPDWSSGDQKLLFYSVGNGWFAGVWFDMPNIAYCTQTYIVLLSHDGCNCDKTQTVMQS